MTDEWLIKKIDNIKCLFGKHKGFYFDGGSGTVEFEVISIPLRCTNCGKILAYSKTFGNKGWIE